MNLIVDLAGISTELMALDKLLNFLQSISKEEYMLILIVVSTYRRDKVPNNTKIFLE